MTWEASNAEADAETDARAAAGSEAGSSADAEDGSVGAHVDSVLKAAERAAMEIKEEARAWARDHIDESRRQAEELAGGRLRELSSLTEDLGSRARAIATECDKLLNAIQDAGRSTSEGSGAKLRIAPMDSQEPDGVADPNGTSESGAADEPQISDRARLIAGQMIAAGDPRDKIATRLREEFGIQDASAMLDRMGA
jgi:hypothetical protein